jgi:gliding motility-associated-like protein
MKQSPGKNTDDALREVFQSKLGNHESAVSDSLWNTIESALPKGGSAAAATSSAAWKSIALWIAGAASVIGTLIAIVSYQGNSSASAQQTSSSQSGQAPSQETNTPAQETNSNEANDRSSSTQNTENRPIPELPSGLTFQLPEVNKIDAFPAASWVKTPSHQESTTVQFAKEQETTILEQEQESLSTQNLNANFTAAALNMGDMTYFFFPEITSNVAYSWQFGDGTISQEQSVNHAFQQPGEYEVELTTTDLITGKSTSTKKTIAVHEPSSIKTPNVFTPNSDGSNDSFDLLDMSTGIESIDLLQITNSSGKVIFEGNASSWNGNYTNGEPCEEDNYYYIVRAKTTDGKMLTRKGIVRLERN